MSDGLEGWYEARTKNIRQTVLGLVLVACVDVGANFLLLVSVHEWKMDFWKPADFFSQFWEFKEHVSDSFLLVWCRVLGLLLLALVAAWIAPHLEDQNVLVEVDKVLKLQKQTKGVPKRLLGNTSSLQTPLLDPARDGGSPRREDDNDGLPEHILDVANAKVSTQSILSRAAVVRLALLRKASLIAMTFIFLTACQIHTGIKAVSFRFNSELLQGALMGSTLLWINIEHYALQKLIHWLTSEKGYLWKEIHGHRLYLETLHCHWCDMCRKKISRGYRCKTCDFDMCLECHRKKNKASAEGQLRGDKGIRQETTVTNSAYMMRGLKLAFPQLHVIFLAFLCLLLTTAASLFLPNFQGRILDQVISGNKAQFYEDIKYYVILSVAVGFFGGVRGLCFNVVGRKMGFYIRNKLFKSLVHQDIAFFDGTTTGQLTSRLSNDANTMVQPMQSMLNTLLSNLILLVGGLFMCFHTSWRLSLLAFTAIGPIIYLTNAYATWSRGIYRDILAALGDANSVATETMGNIRTVRAFSTEPREFGRFVEATTEALNKGLKDAFTSAGTFALTNYLDLGTGVLILWYGGHVAMDLETSLTVGKLITFQLYWNMINSSYQALANVLTSFTRAAGAAQRVLSIVDSEPDIAPDGGSELDRASVKGGLEMRDVHFHYQMRPDNKVLKGVNLDIGPGKVLALVGRSGGGKSTLVHLLMRFYDPKEGVILLDGQPLTDINLLSLHGVMGLVQQDTQLFALTIKENIAYGTENASLEEVIAAAKLANAHDFIMEMEDGYNTRVGERGNRLSGGQKQRISIARVLVRKPRLLFLDEATSALDTESEALVQQALDTLIKAVGCTVVLVAHRLSTVVNADKIAVVHDGAIVEQGTHDELLALGGPYSRLVKRQITRKKNTLTDGNYDPKDIADDVDALVDATDPQKLRERAEQLERDVDVIDSIMDDLDQNADTGQEKEEATESENEGGRQGE